VAEEWLLRMVVEPTFGEMLGVVTSNLKDKFPEIYNI
jgi:hypothetical protein